jgi:hypothetical protein
MYNFPVILTFLERLCTASDHRLGPLCNFIVRRDEWWRGRNPASRNASPLHCEKRERFESGMNALPFPAAPQVAEPAAPEPTAEPAAAHAVRREREVKSA